jgi:hypothetical protein
MESHDSSKPGRTSQPDWSRPNRIERCWRVITAPDGRVATCAIYERPGAGLQLRLFYTDEEVVRVKAVRDVDTARELAETWLSAARAGGGFGPPLWRES